MESCCVVFLKVCNSYWVVVHSFLSTGHIIIISYFYNNSYWAFPSIASTKINNIMTTDSVCC